MYVFKVIVCHPKTAILHLHRHLFCPCIYHTYIIYCPCFYIQQSSRPLSYYLRAKTTHQMIFTLWTVINNCKLFVCSICESNDKHWQQSSFCPEQSKHKSQTFDGLSLHCFSIDGDIRAHFPPFRGSNWLLFIPVLYEKQLPQCKTIHHNYEACICSVLLLSQRAELSIFISLCTLHRSLFTVDHLTWQEELLPHVLTYHIHSFIS